MAGGTVWRWKAKESTPAYATFPGTFKPFEPRLYHALERLIRSSEALVHMGLATDFEAFLSV